MPDKEAIENQLQLLAAYRRTLVQYLKQQAMIGTTYIQPGVTQGIHEARQHIKRIKNTLKSWGVDVEDWPDDEELPEEMPPRTIRSVAIRSTPSSWRYWPIMIGIVAVMLIFLGMFIISRSLLLTQVSASPPATDSLFTPAKGFTIVPSPDTLISSPQQSPQAIAIQLVVSSPEKVPAQVALTDLPTAAPPIVSPTLPVATAQAAPTAPPATAPPAAPPTIPPTVAIAAAQAARTAPPATAPPAAPPTIPPTVAIAATHSTLVPTSTPTNMPTLVGVNLPLDAAQSGLRIVAVELLSPAAQAGFRVGQILLSLNGQATQDVETARSIIAQNQGKPITAIVLDGSILLTLVVTPGAGDFG